MAEVSGHTSECYKCFFHDVNSVQGSKLKLIHSAPHGRDFTKSYKCFFCENLALFTLIRIHCIQKSTNIRNSETRWNPRKRATGNSKLKKLINKEV